MNKPKNGKNIFADKATFILRKMLSNPGKKWVTRDFTGENGVSLGMAQGVLEGMSKKGYIERVKKGPDSFALLTNCLPHQPLPPSARNFYHFFAERSDVTIFSSMNNYSVFCF